MRWSKHPVEVSAAIALVLGALFAFLPTFFRELALSRESQAVAELRRLAAAVEAQSAKVLSLGAACPAPRDARLKPFVSADPWPLLDVPPPTKESAYAYAIVVHGRPCGAQAAGATDTASDAPIKPAVTLLASADLDGDQTPAVYRLDARVSESALRFERPLIVTARTE